MKKYVLKEGETTGHAHVLEGEFEVKGNNFKINKESIVTHEEHDAIKVKRDFELRSVVEVDPITDRIREISD